MFGHKVVGGFIDLYIGSSSSVSSDGGLALCSAFIYGIYLSLPTMGLIMYTDLLIIIIISVQ